MGRAFVLLSGGIDSTTCLYKATHEYPFVEGVSIDYGQRHIKEIEFARATCDYLHVNHKTINARGIMSGKGVMLSDRDVPIPDISYAEIKGVSPTYVPFRNGNLLSIITAHAQKWINEETTFASGSCGIYFGAHSEDAANWAYPDCTPEFIGAMANAIYIGTYQKIRLHTPLQWLNKVEVIKLGESLHVDWRLTWSCYAGNQLHCGICPTCRARKDGFRLAGINDPTEYAK